jgi:hypothetical protein
MELRTARPVLLLLVLTSFVLQGTGPVGAAGDEPSPLASIGSATYGDTGDPLGGRRPWRDEGDQVSSQYGYSVGTAGDVNGDGYADAIVGASYYDNGQEDEGRAFVYHGSAAGLRRAPDWTAESDQAYSYFGAAVSTAGDVNGDGYSDVIVGADWFDGGDPNEGRAFVYHGSAAGLSTTPDWIAESDQFWAFFGISVGTVGDANGDGYDDVIVGASSYSNGQDLEGRAFVYHGSPAGLSATPSWTAESDQALAFFGASVGTAGDVNGDGYDDAIVGAYNYDDGQAGEGWSFVYQGSAAGLSATPDWTAQTDQAFARLGISVGTAGDVNGDGYDDVIVGAYHYTNGQDSEGRAFVYHGSPAGLSAAPYWRVESNQVSALFGFSVGTAGDVNGDGYDDVIVGADYYDRGQDDEGAAFGFYGSADGLRQSSYWSGEGNQVSAHYGASVGTAGDVNGDGYEEAIVGAYALDHPQTDEGLAFVYSGRG